MFSLREVSTKAAWWSCGEAAIPSGSAADFSRASSSSAGFLVSTEDVPIIEVKDRLFKTLHGQVERGVVTACERLD